MKKVNSSNCPESFWIRKKDNKNIYVRLRKNIVEKTRKDDETNSTYFEFDEVEIKIPLMPNVEDYIAQNFDALWMSASPESQLERICYLESLLADLAEELLMGGGTGE